MGTDTCSTSECVFNVSRKVLVHFSASPKPLSAPAGSQLAARQGCDCFLGLASRHKRKRITKGHLFPCTERANSSLALFLPSRICSLEGHCTLTLEMVMRSPGRVSLGDLWDRSPMNGLRPIVRAAWGSADPIASSETVLYTKCGPFLPFCCFFRALRGPSASHCHRPEPLSINPGDTAVLLPILGTPGSIGVRKSLSFLHSGQDF